MRRSSLGVSEGEAAHQLRLAVGMGQHKGDGCLVLTGPLVGENVAASAVTSLVVVVIDEGQSVTRGEQAPFRPESSQPPT